MASVVFAEKRNRRLGLYLLNEIWIGLLTAFVTSILFFQMTAWKKLDISMPISYQGDSLYYANLIRNAQQGSAFKSPVLGGPAGQQYNLSAYGFEWMQAHFVALFAAETEGPWLALNRFTIFAYFMTALVSYFSLRWLAFSRLLSLLGGIAFALVPTHLNLNAPFYQNLVTIPPMLTLLILLAKGKTFREALNADVVEHNSVWYKRGLLILAFFLFAVASASTTTYYSILLTFLFLSVGFLFLFRQNFRSRGRRIIVLGCLNGSIPFFSILPIYLQRIQRGLGISEPSTSDRRAFASYANGGDLWSFFSLNRGGFVESLALKSSEPYKKFSAEYWSSHINNNAEYNSYPIGFIFIGTLLLSSFFLLRISSTKQIIGHSTVAKEELQILLFLLLVTSFWFVRGGLGTLFSFVSPTIRGYSRYSIFISFLVLVLLLTLISAKKYGERIIPILGISLLLLSLIDHASATPRITQDDFEVHVMQVKPKALNSQLTANPNGLYIQSLGVMGTKRLNKIADDLLPRGCTVLALPLVTFPTDFKIGITSTYSYELLKPGLEQTKIKWSSGGIQGTPNNSEIDFLTSYYRLGNYAPLIETLESNKYCGVLFFRGLQNAFYEAGLENQSKYGEPDYLTELLISTYGRPCYSDINSAIDLYCGK